ncbi:ATP binding, partial [Coemansia thaxteri]
EFVVAKPSSPSSASTLDPLSTPASALPSSAEPAADFAHFQGGPPHSHLFEASDDNGGDDDDLWGGAAPVSDVDDDPVAEAMRADLAERAMATMESDDDSRSIASSTRTLPSTMRFTRGMRATLLERRPSRNVHGRPTADVIGEQLDEYFPDHDLDRPIVQSVPVDEGMLPSQEFHIILDEDDGTACSTGSSSVRIVHPTSCVSQTKNRRHLLKTPRPDAESGVMGGTDVGSDSASHSDINSTLLPGVGRRKSVRMLVQETRHQRHQRRPRSRVVDKRVGDQLSAETMADPSAVPSASSSVPLTLVAKPTTVHAVSPRPVVRRQSTKLWGCIPEEIQPFHGRSSLERLAETPTSTNSVLDPVPPVSEVSGKARSAGSSSGGGGRANDEIVRRALSLLRKPEPNPQAEKEIVEAAIKCGDSSTVGSTRAHFVHERARLQAQQQQQQPLEDTAVATWQANGGGAGSVNDAARSLFAKYGIATVGIKIQWIKGKLIGKGSFGHVHVAINAATGEVIAVKQIRLPASLCAAAAGGTANGRHKSRGRAVGLLEEAIRMMYTEVELLRDLDHENIVQLLGFEVTGGVMSMFLEYVPGGTVQSLVQQHGPLPESVVHSFVRQIVAGLGYLHASGVLHRDIKGANILVDETGTCKISDFGVSRKVDHSSLQAAAHKKSGGGKILGTVPFMAPEVARSSQYTAAADIWSLGCVVVQMWSGRGPWDELQEPQVFFKLGRGEAPPIPDDLTEAGLDFCKNCFAADPQARWPAADLGHMPFAQVPRDYEYPYYAC